MIILFCFVRINDKIDHRYFKKLHFFFFFLFILFYHYLIIYKKLKKGSEKPGKNLNYELRIGIFDEWNQEPLLFRHPKGM